MSLAFLVVEEHPLFSTKHVALRSSYKITITQHKHTFHNNNIKQGKQYNCKFGYSSYSLFITFMGIGIDGMRQGLQDLALLH